MIGARAVLDDVDIEPAPRRWAASGAMVLTGDRRGPPLVAPDGVVARIEGLGRPLGVDALPLLGERAAIAGLGRHGSRSCGGGSRLLEGGDGWVAVTLARTEDVELVPAWLETDGAVLDPWPTVADAVAIRPADELVGRGRLLGLPVARVAETAVPDAGPVVAHRLGDAPAHPGGPLVVDLSSLWAGPLCAQLLGERGARVVKVESLHRPDGARRGPSAFFDLLHAGHRSVALDLRTPAGIERLRKLLGAADVVIEASRPRALEQLGIDAADVVRSGPTVWVSITGHGRDGEGRDAVAFGDDAAAAGGLVAWGADGRPRFVADAVADPLTGVAAAAAVDAALTGGGRWLLDVAMSRVAAFVAGADRARPWSPGDRTEAAAPRAREPKGPAPELGAHNDSLTNWV